MLVEFKKYKKKSFLIILLCFSNIYFCPICFSQSSSIREINLQECFNLALARSLRVTITGLQIDQTDAQIKQARAGFMPVLSLQASSFRQVVSSESSEPNSSLTKDPSTFQTTSNLNLSQNLFQGFRDLNNVEQRKHLKMGFE